LTSTLGYAQAITVDVPGDDVIVRDGNIPTTTIE